MKGVVYSTLDVHPLVSQREPMDMPRDVVVIE